MADIGPAANSGATTAKSGAAASRTVDGTPADALDLEGKLGRFGDILTKTLDLAEIGMNLSLSVFSTLGAVAQKKIAEKLIEPMEANAGTSAPAASRSPDPQVVEPEVPGAPAFGVTNRLRLVPGGVANISFSVNNESAASAKQVSLRVERFAGDHTGRFLPPDTLHVSPATQVISPMDFEKFILGGTLPGDTVPDTYRGTVVVASDDIIRIPVWLVVDPEGVEV